MDRRARVVSRWSPSRQTHHQHQASLCPPPLQHAGLQDLVLSSELAIQHSYRTNNLRRPRWPLSSATACLPPSLNTPSHNLRPAWHRNPGSTHSTRTFSLPEPEKLPQGQDNVSGNANLPFANMTVLPDTLTTAGQPSASQARTSPSSPATPAAPAAITSTRATHPNFSGSAAPGRTTRAHVSCCRS